MTSNVEGQVYTSTARGTVTKQDALRSECEAAGFTFDTYSPGDGVTRYRFTKLGVDGANDYFASFGDFTALGWKEALAYATGRVHGAAQE